MSISGVLIVSLLSLLFVRWLWSRRKFYRIYMKLPGPLGLPFLGIGCEMLKPLDVINIFHKKSKEYKTPFITWLGTHCYLYVNDPESLETILQSPACTNKGNLYRFIADVIGDGLVTSSTPLWNKHRRLLNPAFGRKTIESFMPVFNKEANVLLNKFSESENQSLELFELFCKTVLEVTCQTTMGQKMNFHNNESLEIIHSYTSLMNVGMRRIMSPWLHPDVIYRNCADMKSQQLSVGVVNEFTENLLRSRINSSKASAKNSHKSHVTDGIEEPEKQTSKVFMERLLRYIENGQLTFEEVVGEINIVVAAAFETTATTLYFVCLCLAMHPEYQDKLYNELVELFPSNDKELDVTLEHLDHMPYMEMVINEAMRLFAAVPLVLRSASSDFHLRDGIVIPQGTQIFIDIFNMHREEKIWGPNARSFDPERHFGDPSQQHPYAFVPFTKGLRMCIGYRFAQMLIKTFVAKIFRNYRVLTEAKMTDLAFFGSISLKLSQYPTCKFQLREPTLSTPKASQDI